MKPKPMIYQTERKIELLYKDNYKDYNYYILNLGTHPTAYVEIPKGHKLYGKDYYDIYIDVHGGLTYSDNELMLVKSDSWFIGWDYAHFGDYMGYYTDEMFLDCPSLLHEKQWTIEEIIKDCESVIDQIIEMENSNE